MYQVKRHIWVGKLNQLGRTALYYQREIFSCLQ